ncbi:hypothetical protein [Mastigocoleus testarum]|nr:hypothetical protein [Mastigocoleus testarum]
MGIGDWRFGIGDLGLAIWDWRFGTLNGGLQPSAELFIFLLRIKQPFC